MGVEEEKMCRCEKGNNFREMLERVRKGMKEYPFTAWYCRKVLIRELRDWDEEGISEKRAFVLASKVMEIFFGIDMTGIK